MIVRDNAFNMKKRVLFVINTSTYFSSLFFMARFLKKSGEYTPVFFFSQSYLTIDAHEKLCRKEGIKFFKREEKKTASRSKIAAGKIILGGLLRKFFLIEFLVVWTGFKKEIAYITRLLKKVRPDLIVLAGDIVAYNTSIFIKKGHEVKIPTIVFPLWMAGPKESAEFIFGDPNYSAENLLNRLAAKMYPKWAYVYEGKKLLCLPWSQIFAKEWLGISSPLPWALHSSGADVIALESEAVKSYCLREGLQENCLKVVGSLHNDILSRVLSKERSLRLALCRELNFDEKKPIILAALPPDFLYIAGGRSECEFSSYRELVEFYVKALVGSPRRQVIISLHPSVRIDDFRYIEKWGAKISDKNIIELIPLCDIFAASISATIQWAIACSKPVLNYDVYKYRYGDYDRVPGVINVEHKADFVKYLKKLSSDSNFYKKIAQKQKSAASEWGMLDGKSGARILKLTDRLIETYSRNGKK